MKPGKPGQRIGSAEVQREYVDTMTEVARVVDFAFNGPVQPKKVGFILMVFPFDDALAQGRCNYMSNADRKDVIVLLKEQLRYFEGQADKHGPGHS